MNRLGPLLLVILCIVGALGCAGEKPPAEPASAGGLPPQQISVPAPAKPKPPEPWENNKPTKTRSAQQAIATFRVDSADCVIGGKPVTMAAPLRADDFILYLPARAFAQAIGIPGGEITLGKKTFPDDYLGDKNRQFDSVAMTRGGLTVTGAWLIMTIDGKKYEVPGKAAYCDPADVPYIGLRAFGRAFGYDTYWDPDSGTVELLTGLPLAEDDLLLASLKPERDDNNKVSLVLGTPTTVKDYRANGHHDLIYPDFTIRLGRENEKNQILSITTTSPKYQTHRGITVGNDIAAVIERYGMGYYFNKKQSCYYYTFLTTHVDHEKFVAFVAQGDKVVQIKVGDYWIP